MQPTSADRCAYYGRVSTRRQKLEHQREAVERFCEQNGIAIPPELRFEDKERRHKAEKRHDFQALLEVCRRGSLDWIIIATFDRWGVADVDEFFDFRKQLRQCGVHLWSVNDHLALTGATESDYFRVVTHAVACTAQMTEYANRNILKMVQMALAGWHASGSVPFGCDLLCCTLSDRQPLFRVHTIRRPRDGTPLYRIIHSDGREETSGRMPPRDCKSTGYVLVPSIEQKRIDTVRLIYELYDTAMTLPKIRRYLWSRGYGHYGKPFQDNALITILQNPAYVGKPAWGKYAIGHYRQVFKKSPERPRQRKKGEAKQYYKSLEDCVFPHDPVFPADTFVPFPLWERVQQKFAVKRQNKKDRPRTRNRENHPLNGRVVCPDCGMPMVTGRAGRRGKVVHYFICGNYAKTQHLACRANSVPWVALDAAAGEWLKRVKAKLGELANVKLDRDSLRSLSTHLDAAWRVLCKLFVRMMFEMGESRFELPFDPRTASGEEVRANWISALGGLQRVLSRYEKWYAKQDRHRDRRVAHLEEKIVKLGSLIEETDSPVLRKKWLAEVDVLEKERASFIERGGSLLEQLATATETYGLLRERIAGAKGLQLAGLYDVLLKQVEPIMQAETMRNGKQRTHVVGFRFVPNGLTAEGLEALEIPCSRTDTDLARQST